ncbi:MAG: hypothetical protein FJ319_00180 [SAR202 cluster bacterium]|nr:hypothetical protein [SAR202 cluster bacterium]
MSATISVDPGELMAEHTVALRTYARMVLMSGEALTEAEEADRKKRMEELLEIGRGFNLTDNEMVGQLYRDVLRVKPGCGCANCRMRAGRK